MQVYVIIMEGKQKFYIWNSLIVNRLTGPGLMSLWNEVGAKCKDDPASLMIT